MRLLNPVLQTMYDLKLRIEFEGKASANDAGAVSFHGVITGSSADDHAGYQNKLYITLFKRDSNV